MGVSDMNLLFFVNSALLGVGLAMDAFSVSLANGLGEPDMTKARSAAIAGTFAGFQAFMPLFGWVLVKTAARVFGALGPFIPWIALVLLCFIGGKMLLEGIREQRSGAERGENAGGGRLGTAALFMQGVATSVDALSVGFTIAEYDWLPAAAAALVIAAVTFAICLIGLRLGRVFGTKLAGKASILGGAILILIGIEIFARGFFG